MKIPKFTVPVLVVAAILAGLGVAELFAIPTVEIDFDAGEPERSEVLRLIIPGVRCADTARTAAGNLEDVDGVVRYVSYASHNRVEITYDATRTDQQALIEAIEGPVYDVESGEFRFGLYTVSEIETE